MSATDLAHDDDDDDLKTFRILCEPVDTSGGKVLRALYIRTAFIYL